MATMTVDDIVEATGGVLFSENSITFQGISIDSRTIGDGELFFAIRGDTFDGHDYLEKALMKGSGAVVASSPEGMPAGKVIICVHDTLRSLQDLAHFLRMKKDIPVVAVTGSNGKTTTKEMISLILSGKFKVLKNEGNLNNHIGLPLTLTQVTPEDEVIVLEMGMNAAGEIGRLCEIAVPSHGIITNIGSAHVGMLGGYAAVRSAKLEILEGLGVAVVNGDDDYLMQGVAGIKDYEGKVITFGIESDSSVMAREVTTTEKGSLFTLSIGDEKRVPVALNVHGLFNVYNALAASAVAYSLGMNVDEIKVALDSYRAFPMRFEVTRKEGVTIINDSYNANPSSMKESVRELVRLGGSGRVVAILGDMLELGEFTEDEHRDVGRMISDSGVDVLVTVGAMMGLAAEECIKRQREKKGPETHVFRDVHGAEKNITDILKKGDTVLIKGSRSMTMEKVMEGIVHAL